jgi:hypothetical protein
MAAVTVTSNAGDEFKKIGLSVLGLSDNEIFRPLIFDLIDMMKERIHRNGQASDESQIGTYSPGYMAVRTGIFKTPGTKFTKGKNKGAERPRYNRDNSTKIIVSLTRQLENSWIIIATDNGYDIGFSDAESGSGGGFKTSYEKARLVEEVKGKVIFDLSQTELDYIDQFIDKKIEDLIK